jgi:4-amino-4-deoxy-L-arabinose transferase-like glycosyltransferase
MLAGLALRASDLRADPPPGLSWSFAPYTDEAYNNYSARNMVLYGKWKVDDFFPFVVYPLTNFLAVLVFKLFGLGFVQVKLISLLAGVASVFVIYLLVKEDSGPLAGQLAALGLAVSFPLVMYSRLGLVESVQLLFLLLTGLFFVRGLKRPRQMLWAGLFGASTILLVKVSAVFVAPALLFAWLWELIDRRKDRAAVQSLIRGLWLALAGIGVACTVWLVAVFLPHRADYVQYVLRHSFESPAGHPKGLVAYLANAFTIGVNSRVTTRLPWIAFVGFAALPAFAFGRRPGLRYCGLWFLLAFLMLGYMNYRPDRYEIILIPALIAAFAAALARILETGTLVPKWNSNVLKAALYTFWLWPLAAQAVLYSNGLAGMVHPETESGLIFTALTITVLLGLVGFAATRVFRNGVHLAPVLARAALAGVVLVLSLRIDLVQYFAWFNTRTHNMIAYSADLDRFLPDDAVLAGSFAPALLINSRKRAVCITDWANTDDPVGRFGVTHIVSPENGFDIELFTRTYPRLMERAKVLREYEVYRAGPVGLMMPRQYGEDLVVSLEPRGTKLTVYELPRP